MLRKSTSLILMALFISGCNDNKELLSRIKALEDNLESLKSTVEINEFVSQFSNNNVAFLKPGDGGYSVVNFDLGKLTIAIDNATQYAGGVRVTFKIGNTLSSTITELSADFEYGQLNENKTPTENIIRKKVKFQDELKGGSWNKTTVVLEGIELKDLGYIRIKNLSHSGIKLTGRY